MQRPGGVASGGDGGGVGGWGAWAWARGSARARDPAWDEGRGGDREGKPSGQSRWQEGPTGRASLWAFSLSSPGAGLSFAACGQSSWGGPSLSTTKPRAVSLLVEGPCRAPRVTSDIPEIQSLGDRSGHFLSCDYESLHVTVAPGGQESVVQTRCSNFELLWEAWLPCRAGIPVSAQGARGHPQD